MAIPLGDKKVPTGTSKPEIIPEPIIVEDPLFQEGIKVPAGSYIPEEPKTVPTIRFRREFTALKVQTLGTVSSKLTINPTSFTINGDGFYQLIFTDYIYDNDGNPTYGFFDLKNDTEIRINGVFMGESIYTITEVGTTIYVDFLEDLEFSLDANDVIDLRARVKNA